MQCLTNDECPLLYNCINENCQHQPLTDICPQILICIFLVPFLLGLSNRIGISTFWVIYPALITFMAYQYIQSLGLIAPIALASSFIMLFLSLKDKSQTGSGPAINFYVINAAVPSLVVSINLGLLLSKIIPFVYICFLGLVASIVFLVLSYKLLKDNEADQKINGGHLRKMLPSRLQNSKKLNLTIQLALIQEADSQIQQNQNELSPTRKTRMRTQLLQRFQNDFPYDQLFVCLLSFLAYECLALSLPETIQWLGGRQQATKFGLSYGILVALIVAGEIYIYKFYVQPQKIKQEQSRVNLGVKIDGQKMIKICLIGFLGGLLEGLIGFGLSFFLFFYLIKLEFSLKDSIATGGFLTVFIATSFTLSSIFCGNFNCLHYLIIFLLTLVILMGFQYLFNNYLENNTKPESMNSTLIILLTIILISNLFSILLSFCLSWVRFGFDTINHLGVVKDC